MPTATTVQQILVVDDDKDIVRLVRAYLEKAGFQVLTAYDGETALHILRHDKPALLVLDLMLPDADGWDITRLVRVDPNLAQTPIIMLTARVDDTDKIISLPSPLPIIILLLLALSSRQRKKLAIGLFAEFSK